MGSGKVFRVPCKLSKNGISISILALPDSGAHGFCFLDRSISVKICSRLGIVPIALPRPITPKGYNGVSGRIITHFLVTTMIINGYTLPQIPFLILDLGNQDVILGDAWMAHFDVLPDLRQKKLFWRNPPKNKPSFQRELIIPREFLRQPLFRHDYQTDADRRDKTFLHNEERAKNGAKKHNATINYLNFYHKPNTNSTINLFNLEETFAQRDKLNQINTDVPSSYHDFQNVFSKEASDLLPPRRPYDHKIELEKDAKMMYGPLCNQSTEELEEIRKYLFEKML